MARITLDPSWQSNPKVISRLEELDSVLSSAQKKLLTPIFINSTTLEVLKDAYMTLFKKTGSLHSPAAFRYSYSFKVAGKNIMATTLYHLERDFSMMVKDYGASPKVDLLKMTDSKWEKKAYEQLQWFEGTAEQAVDKLITCKGSDGKYYGWYFKEFVPDNPVK